MDNWIEYIKYFTGLLAIVNPIGAIPVFISLTKGQSILERKETAFLASITAGTVLIFALLTGEMLLHFFGITIASFRVGGGILIIIMSISMVHAQISPVKHTEEEAIDAAEREFVAIVPLGIPLLAGPGSISTVVLYAHIKSSLTHHILIGLEILIVTILIWLAFRSAHFVESLLGRTGINIVTRVMGLFMMAIGVEFITDGLKQLLPGLS